MATRSFIDLASDPKPEELDLVLRLGKDDKGKRPLEASPERDAKRKRMEEEWEEASTGHSSENQIVLLKKRIDELEKLVKFQHMELSSRIDKFFFYATQCFCTQNQKSIECTSQVYNTLHELIRVFKSRMSSEVMLSFPPIRPRVPGGASGNPSSSSRPPTAPGASEAPSSSTRPPKP